MLQCVDYSKSNRVTLQWVQHSNFLETKISSATPNAQAGVGQSAEQPTCNEKVGCSIHLFDTKKWGKLLWAAFFLFATPDKSKA